MELSSLLIIKILSMKITLSAIFLGLTLSLTSFYSSATNIDLVGSGNCDDSGNCASESYLAGTIGISKDQNLGFPICV